MEDYDFYVSEGISECFGLLIWVDFMPEVTQKRNFHHLPK